MERKENDYRKICFYCASVYEEKDKVRSGQKLMTFDISKIKTAGYSTTSAVLLTNSDDYQSCNVVKTGKSKQMEKIITVE